MVNLDYSEYRDTVGNTVKRILEENLPEGLFKMVYYGDNLIIPQTYLPCICIVPRSGDVTRRFTGVDQDTQVLDIRIVFNKKDEFGKSTNEVKQAKTCELIAKGRDRITGEYSGQSIFGILRKKFSLEGVTVRNELSYVFEDNADRLEIVTYEGIVTATFEELIHVNNSS